jgi:CRISPR-associated endonuclease/helicase Cas3
MQEASWEVSHIKQVEDGTMMDATVKNTNYIAHSKNADGKWHFLKDHLNETETFMKSFTHNANYSKIFAQTALLHDFGKYQQKFQEYIHNGGPRGSAPHACWGASFARYLNQPEIAFVVDGHHKGLPDKSDLKIGTVSPEEWNLEKYQKVTETFLQDIGKAEQEFEKTDISFNELQQEVFIRYLFSSLTDADWLSTEKHLKEEVSSERKNVSLDYDCLINLLEEDVNKKNKDGHINVLRNKVRQYALSLAALPIGFYSLGLPTGLGKTLTSFAWALAHAKKHNLKRIIMVIPYLSIIDQTAKIFKKIFGEQWILEHHSSYNEEEIQPEQKTEHSHTKKLATENWNYPIIITTTVQFFDSLFSNKPKRCRKVHNIADSVVIFDEVQTLPPSLLEPILSILQDIKDIMGTSFLFCTATQPAFEKRMNFRNGIEHIVPLVKEPRNLFGSTKRVDYKPVHNFEPLRIERLIAEMNPGDDSTLAIFNTKQNALRAYFEAKKAGQWNKFYHLSKAMCSDHRKEMIEQIRTDLNNGEFIFVVSTQLVEAGVDFDFPRVYREIAPLESIIQAAGRCNREGALLQAERMGKVFIFRLENTAFPDKLYETLSLHTMKLLEQNIDQLHDYNFFTSYYAGIVNLFVDTDKKRINDARKGLKFKTVADMFRLIEDTTISLFIANYSKETLEFLNKIRYKEILNKADYYYIQRHSVQVYRNFLEKTRGQWEQKEQGYHVWYGSYRKDTGICQEPALSDYIY